MIFSSPPRLSDFFELLRILGHPSRNKKIEQQEGTSLPVRDFLTKGNRPVKILPRTTYSSAVILLLLFAGCGPVLNPYEEHFKCKTPGDDGKCIDTPTAYMDARYSEGTGYETTTTETPSLPHQNIHDARYRILTELLEKSEKPLLQPPKILRVLMLPYEGANGELFMTRYVYVQVEDAQWLLTEQREKGVQ